MTMANAGGFGNLPEGPPLLLEVGGSGYFSVAEHALPPTATGGRVAAKNVMLVHDVFTARNPFQICGDVVGFNAVNVIDEWLDVAVGHEDLGNQTMDKSHLRTVIYSKPNAVIPLGGRS